MRFVNAPAARRTPSRRRWSRPCDDASMERCVTPSPASRSSNRCNATGSGVVRLPLISPFGVITPSVPMLAACLPTAVQIWRVNEATEVFPLVPVTATTVAGCRTNNFAAPRASMARASATRTKGMLAGRSLGRSPSPTIATAPRFAASAAKRDPSARLPATATKRSPALTSRLSAVRPETAIPAGAWASGPRRLRSSILVPGIRRPVRQISWWLAVEPLAGGRPSASPAAV